MRKGKLRPGRFEASSDPGAQSSRDCPHHGNRNTGPGVGRGGGPGGGPGRGRRLTPWRTRAPRRRQYASRLERCGRRHRHHPPPLPPPDAREEMYQARPLSRNLFLYTFLQNHGPGFLDDQDSGLPGVTSILEFHPVSPYSDSPHYLAMQLASIADEMELRLLLPQFDEPFWMTTYSLFFPYSHVGLRDVLRSLMAAFTNLRENRRLWSFLTLRDRVSPSLWPELALSLLVVAMLSWGCRLH
nr:bcl-2-interacting killer [Odocoileus virginianus texanus]